MSFQPVQLGWESFRCLFNADPCFPFPYLPVPFLLISRYHVCCCYRVLPVQEMQLRLVLPLLNQRLSVFLPLPPHLSLTHFSLSYLCYHVSPVQEMQLRHVQLGSERFPCLLSENACFPFPFHPFHLFLISPLSCLLLSCVACSEDAVTTCEVRWERF